MKLSDIHRSSSAALPHNAPLSNFSLNTIRNTLALIDFRETPKLTTRALKTSTKEDDPFYCVTAKSRDKITFLVVQQDFILLKSMEGMPFTVHKVTSKRKKDYWLVARQPERIGFLLPFHVLDSSGMQIIFEKR